MMRIRTQTIGLDMIPSESSHSEVEAALYSYLAKRFPTLSPCGPDTPLLENGVIDSLGILELMNFLSDRFGITLDDVDFTPENLETPARLVRFIERKRC